MRLSATLFALLFVGAAASAQPAGLQVTPDTLRHVSGGASVPFVITNTGATPLALDSIVVGIRGQLPSTGIRGRFAYTGTETYWEAITGYRMYWYGQEGIGSFPATTLAQGEEARFIVDIAGYCALCFAGGGSGSQDYVAVRFYAGGSLTPMDRTLGFDYIVAAEAGSGSTSRALTVTGPNPFAGETSLRLELTMVADVDVALYDALGRRVRTLAAGQLGAGPHDIAVGASGLSPGLYFARAVVGAGQGATAETRRLVLSR